MRLIQSLVGALLLIYPWLVSPFWATQIGAQSLLLGIISLSLMFLGGYGGMVSLAQMTVAGAAGYALAIFGGAAEGHGLHWPWWVALPLAIGIAIIVATLIGAISVRTEGIYTIMITLAIAVALFYLAQQNYDIFNGFDGFKGLAPPMVFGVNWRDAVPFYYLTLAVAALAYFAVTYLSRSTFGLALQALRDNPRRMRALGFNVTLHRVLAYTVAGLIAALGGVLSVWYHARISPGSIGLTPVINMLIIAVLGGLRHPVGPFLGAIVFVLLQNFAVDFIDRERFNTLIGLVFLGGVLFSSDGLLGLSETVRTRFRTRAGERPGWRRATTAESPDTRRDWRHATRWASPGHGANRGRGEGGDDVRRRSWGRTETGMIGAGGVIGGTPRSARRSAPP
jgi:branched-chain amino acid transport system permease protein